MTKLVTAALFAFTLTFAGAARAAVPPISDAELAARAELIIEAKVTSTSCGAVVDKGNRDHPWKSVEYLATLMVKSTTKGQPPTPLVFLGIRIVGIAPLGPNPAPPLAVGWVGKLYLSAAGQGRYSTTYDGPFSVREDKTQSQPEAVLTCPAVNGDGGLPDGQLSVDGGADGGLDSRPDSDIDVATPDGFLVDADTGRVAPADLGTAETQKPDTATPVVPDAIKAADAPVSAANGDDGCSCDLGGRPSGGRSTVPGGTLLAALGMVLLVRRRRS